MPERMVTNDQIRINALENRVTALERRLAEWQGFGARLEATLAPMEELLKQAQDAIDAAVQENSAA